MNDILIVGAGIAGLCLAKQLKKYGIAYTLIEKKSELDMTGAGIALPANATRALRYMGLSDFVDSLHQVKRILYSRANGKVISQASLLEAPLNLDKFVALSRCELLIALQQSLQDDIHFNVSVTSLQQKDSGVDVIFSNPAFNGHYQAVIGADGLHSSIRQLGFGSSEPVDLGVTTWRWMCEHPTDNLQPTYLFGRRNLFLAYPTGKHRIYCYAHQADATGYYHDREEAGSHLSELFAHYQGIAKPLLAKLPPNMLIHTGRLRSVPFPLFTKQSIALVGDASSACSPMLQQGAASAFEDVITLSTLLVHFPIKTAFELYQQQRSLRVNWVVTTSDAGIQSFIKLKSPWAAFMRNLLIKYKGPLNVLGWRHLLSSCPLDHLDDFINIHRQDNQHEITSSTDRTRPTNRGAEIV